MWNSITIGYSAILISFVVLVSYKTRKIHRKDFKNTKKINIFLAVVVSATAVLLPLWWVFRSVDNTVMSRIVIVSLYLLLPVSCQACLFCPKTLPPLQRSFSKAVCQRRRQSKERSRSTEKVLYLQRPDPSQLSLLLPQDSTLSYTLVLNKPTSTSWRIQFTIHHFIGYTWCSFTVLLLSCVVLLCVYICVFQALRLIQFFLITKGHKNSLVLALFPRWICQFLVPVLASVALGLTAEM